MKHERKDTPEPLRELRFENFGEDLSRILSDIGQSSDSYRNDRDRPYNGQPHTDQGIRGKTLVEGLTMRDVYDCMVMGFLQAGAREEDDFALAQKVEDGTWCADDVYKIDPDFDPIAVIQCALCNVEKFMGIYPNVPKLKTED